MLKLDLKVNLNNVDKNLESKSKQINNKLIQLNRDITDIAHRWVQRKAPRKTGKFKTSIQKKSTGTTGTIWNDLGIAPYGDYILDGTKPHLITANSSKALFWPGASHPVKKVHHPGTKPNPVFDNAFPNIEAEADRKIKAFENWLGEV